MFLVTICLTILFTSIIALPSLSIKEWGLHRYVMHRPVGAFRYPYEAHTRIHHGIFRWDHTYHVQNKHDAKKIPMAWWNGLVLVTIAMIPFALSSGVFALIGYWGIFYTSIATSFFWSAVYYGWYEYSHWCMHFPKHRRLEKSSLFRKWNGHHLLHHRYMNKNFNVVFPFADWLFGTLMRRARTKFAQARGDSVPDVQPVLSPA